MKAGRILERLGPRLYHVTAANSAASINRTGLLTPNDLALRAGLPEDEIVLRKDRREITFEGHRAILNHQLPLRAGMRSASEWLDDCSIEDWSRQLDRRVFFWVNRPNKAFKGSVAEDVEVCVFSLSTEALLRRFGEAVWLSPINSGNARRRPASRGTWIYVSTNVSWADYRENRRKRGLVSTADTAVVEVSVTRSLSPDDLEAVDWRSENE